MQRADNYPFKDKIALVAEGCLPGAYLDPINANRPVNKTAPKITQRDILEPYVKEIFNKVHNCGFNAFISDDAIATAEYILEKTDGEPYALPAILRFSNVAMEPYRIIPAIKQFKKNARVIGYNYKDEPEFWSWGDALMDPQYDNKGNEIFYSTSQWSFLTAWNAVCSELVPGSLGYWTLAVPVKGSEQEKNVLGTCKDYEQYLKTLDRLYKPVLWAYDVYPIQKKIENAGTKDNEKEKTLIEVQHAHFYNSFRMFRNQSVKTGNIFWAYAMVLDHSWYEKGESQYSVNLPTPTLGSLRFEIFSALAYGAQGLMFSRMGMEKNIDNIEQLEAPFSWGKPATGSSAATTILRSDVCGYMKTVNEEIDKCSHIFLGCNCLKTAHTGNLFGQSPASFPFGCLQCVKADGNGVLLSELQLQDSKATVIVNHDPFHTQKIETTLDDTKKPVLAYPESKHPTSGTVRTLTLDPGGAIIFTYK